MVAIANGIRVPDAPAATGAPAEHGSGAPYVLAIGTVEPRKDYPTLVRAFGALADAHADLRLVIAGGDGLAADALTEAIAAPPHRHRIDRPGRADDARRGQLLEHAAVLAYPSRYEGFGLVPLEAMAVGTPVVATAVGAIPEVVGDAAELVAPGDPDALAAALDRVLVDGELRDRLRSAGRVRVDAHPWSATVDGLVDLYRTVRR